MSDQTNLERAREDCPVCEETGRIHSVAAYEASGERHTHCPECARVAPLLDAAEERGRVKGDAMYWAEHIRAWAGHYKHGARPAVLRFWADLMEYGQRVSRLTAQDEPAVAEREATQGEGER